MPAGPLARSPHVAGCYAKSYSTIPNETTLNALASRARDDALRTSQAYMCTVQLWSERAVMRWSVEEKKFSQDGCLRFCRAISPYGREHSEIGVLYTVEQMMRAKKKKICFGAAMRRDVDGRQAGG